MISSCVLFPTRLSSPFFPDAIRFNTLRSMTLAKYAVLGSSLQTMSSSRYKLSTESWELRPLIHPLRLATRSLFQSLLPKQKQR